MWAVELSVEESKKRFEAWFQETRQNYLGTWGLYKTNYYDTDEMPQYFINTKHKGYKGCFVWLTRHAGTYNNWYRIEKALTKKVEEGYFIIRDSDYSELITKVDEFLDDSDYTKLCGMRSVS